MLRILSFIFCLPYTLLPALPASGADSMTISNQCGKDILNILLIQDADKEKKENFLRLDLEPGSATSVESLPDVTSMRLDNGLEFVSLGEVPLKDAKAITISGDECKNIKIELDGKEELQITGAVQSLIPQPGEKIVCELSRFRPKMPMAEVCQIIPNAAPTDDNGALITGLGFAGLVWAGRLTPEHSSSHPQNILLEHMELRRPLNRADLSHLLQHLYQQGYVPWQAEMPGAELDFADMPDKNTDDRKASLQDVLTRYLEHLQTHTGEATIMLAPSSILDALANSDEPEQDVQLFTLTIKPKSETIVLDVAAYEGNKS